MPVAPPLRFSREQKRLLLPFFHARVEFPRRGGCWRWVGALNTNGYGFLLYKRAGLGRQSAHRVAYAMLKGPIPKGLNVCHTCDNPPCVNPDHLFLGTTRMNALDAKAKGRLPSGDRSAARLYPKLYDKFRGSGHGNAELTEKQVREIRRRYRSEWITQEQLARKYRVAQTTISYVLRTGWTHVAGATKPKQGGKWATKLTLKKAKAIVRAVAAGSSQSGQARKYGVSTGYICRIVHGEAWPMATAK